MKKFTLIITALFASIILFSGCKKEEYVVTFTPNGGKGTVVTQRFTVKIKQPLMANTFTYDGYKFTGWNNRANGGGTSYQDQEIVKISEHLVLYAQWTPATGDFTVTFKANGGEGEMEPQKFEAGVPKALEKNIFTCAGYDFSGWCSEPNGIGTKFADEQIITITANTILYAQWTKK